MIPHDPDGDVLGRLATIVDAGGAHRMFMPSVPITPHGFPGSGHMYVPQHDTDPPHTGSHGDSEISNAPSQIRAAPSVVSHAEPTQNSPDASPNGGMVFTDCAVGSAVKLLYVPAVMSVRPATIVMTEPLNRLTVVIARATGDPAGS